MSEIFFNKLNSIRKKKKITYEEISKLSGISRSTLWKWEKGASKPKELHIRAIASSLGVSVSEISDMPQEKVLSDKKLYQSVQTWFDLAQTGISNEYNDIKLLSDSLKRIYNKLTHSSIIIKGLMNATNSYLYIRGNDFKYLIFNNQFKKEFGITNDSDLSQITDKDLYSEKEAEFNEEEDRNVIYSGNAVINREGIVPGTRKKKWGLISKIPICDQEGKIQGLIGIFVDITERKHNEELREILEINVNSMTDGISIMNIDNSQYLYMNKAREKIYGYSNDQFIKNGVAFRNKCIHPDDREKEIQFYIKKEWPELRTFRIITPEGKQKWIECRTSINYFMGMKCYFSIQRDITEKVESKKLEEQHISRIKDMENLLFNIPYLIYVHRKTNDALSERNSEDFFTNNKEYLILGLTKEEVCKEGKNWVNHILPGYRQKIFDLLNSNLPSVEMEYPIKCPKSKKIRWLKEVCNTNEDKVFGIVHDITELKIVK